MVETQSYCRGSCKLNLWSDTLVNSQDIKVCQVAGVQSLVSSSFWPVCLNLY